MRICQIVPSLEEIHGGPSKSAYAVAEALAGLGQDVALLATHADRPERRSAGQLNLTVFRRDHPRWLCPSAGLRRHLRAAPADLVHHHSLWLRTLHYARLQAANHQAPLVISPRGMMSSWAWNHHRWRKEVVRRLVHPRALESAAGWHATSQAEADDIRALGFRQPICVAPNGVFTPTAAGTAAGLAYWREVCPPIARQKTALFYSRFHRKKRVIELVDVWLARAPKDWVLLMVGLPDDYTAAQIETYVLRSSGGGRIHVYEGEGRPSPYPAASLFLLPSHSENFGLAVAEAMANGLPVVVTDSTPWAAVNRNDAGWCVNWDDYPSAITTALAESVERLAERGRAARKYVLTEFSWEQSARNLLQFYHQLVGLNV